MNISNITSTRASMVTRTIVISLTSVAIYFSSVAMQAISYDMIGYVASAFSIDGFQGAELQENTVQDIKNSVSAAKYKSFTDGSEYWSTVLIDQKSLQQIVPLYAIRIAYIELMRLVHKFGESYTTASIQIGAFFGGLVVIVMGLIMIKVKLPIVMLVTNFLAVAKLPSPDTMACFFALVSVYLLMTGSRVVFLILIFMPLVRTDLIILSGIILVYMYFSDKSKSRLFLYISAVLSVIAFMYANKVHGNYGLLNLFNNHHVHHDLPKSLYPADIEISTRVRDYVMPYIWLIRDALSNSHAVIYMIAISIVVYARRIRLNIKYQFPLFVIPFTYVLLHLLAFPAYFERFFMFSIFLTLLGIMHFLKFQLYQPVERHENVGNDVQSK